MTIETKPRMTVREIALMRAIVKWRKANGVEVPGPQSYRNHDGRLVTRTAYFGPAEIGVAPRYGVTIEWHRVHSFTNAVDLLVALGYLPARFSSAYAAGWHAAQVWEQHPATARRGWAEEFRRLFHDPYNISFPAVEK
jgi:hypothetical protein